MIQICEIFVWITGFPVVLLSLLLLFVISMFLSRTQVKVMIIYK